MLISRSIQSERALGPAVLFSVAARGKASSVPASACAEDHKANEDSPQHTWHRATADRITRGQQPATLRTEIEIGNEIPEAARRALALL